MSDGGSRADRIVVLLHDFYAGGAERVAITLANAWQRAGRDVALLCGSEDGPFRSRVGPGVHVHGVAPPIPQGRLSRLRLGWACIGPVRGLAPDLVFAPGNFHLPVIGVAARARYPRRPVFACKLSNRLYRPSRASARQWIFDVTTRAWVARLDGLVAMSPALRAEARARLRQDDVECIWEPGVSGLPAPDPDRGGADGVLQLVIAGRLVAEKNVSLMLRTLAVLVRRTRARLTVVGDGPLRQVLQAEAEHLGVADRVRWTGHVPDIRPWLAAADALVSTSIYEGYPAVLIEALAAGVPIIATDSTPALPEILFHPTFGCVAPATPAALAAAIERVARTRPAPAAVARLIDRHRIDGVAAAYLAWFDRLVARNPAFVDRPAAS